jgi:nitroimidazol reductase NimA-like FMN-containing flavoprotein (pyridoxamine 5'-phosphate oxidase superfamily)
MDERWLDEMTYEECVGLLRESNFGRIAIVVDSFPIVLPVNFRLVESPGRRWIALRTRPGNVIDQSKVHVAFEIDGVDPPRHEGWSVLVRGTLHRVDPDAADFRERFDPEPWLLADREAWLVIEPFSITGRRLHAPEGAWAFHPDAYL